MIITLSILCALFYICGAVQMHTLVQDFSDPDANAQRFAKIMVIVFWFVIVTITLVEMLFLGRKGSDT